MDNKYRSNEIKLLHNIFNHFMAGNESFSKILSSLSDKTLREKATVFAIAFNELTSMFADELIKEVGSSMNQAKFDKIIAPLKKELEDRKNDN